MSQPLRRTRLLNCIAMWTLPLAFPGVLLGFSSCSSETGDGTTATGGAGTGGGNSGSGGRSSGGSSGATGGSTGGVANPSGGAATGGAKSGGAPGNGGANTGGAPAKGGTAGATGGSVAAGGTTGGQNGGAAGAGKTGGSGGAAGSATAGAAGSGGGGGGEDKRPWFSFFVTSLEGLLSLAPDKTNGFGGKLGGLEGADNICATLAKRGNPGDNKVWRAFLSTAGYNGGTKVDAIDRVGPGPWYDLTGRLFAQNVAGLDPESNDGRPDGARQLAEMFATELGEPMRKDQSIDNHDSLTGSDERGRLHPDGEKATCYDWTNNTLHAEIPVGHGWPRSDNNGRNWILEHTVNGCEPGVFIGIGGGAPDDNFTVGGGGGYGAFYCFALGATPPPP